jgi:hypothetical protein
MKKKISPNEFDKFLVDDATKRAEFMMETVNMLAEGDYHWVTEDNEDLVICPKCHGNATGPKSAGAGGCDYCGGNGVVKKNG